MVSTAQATLWFFADVNLPAETSEVLAVFCGAGLFIVIVFGTQLFLIHQIEQGHLRRPYPQLSMVRRFRHWRRQKQTDRENRKQRR